MIKQHEKGTSITDICKAQQVTRKVFYTIKDTYNQEGLSALEDKGVVGQGKRFLKR